MPLKAEPRHRYPPHGRALRAALRERAGHRGAPCGVPNRTWRNHRTDTWTHDASLAEAWRRDGDPVARIVLTMAHLDHTPEHHDPANRAALCQRGHLAHDREQHWTSAYATRRKPRALGDLFDVAVEP